jgi:hypothetical protein
LAIVTLAVGARTGGPLVPSLICSSKFSCGTLPMLPNTSMVNVVLLWPAAIVTAPLGSTPPAKLPAPMSRLFGASTA